MFVIEHTTEDALVCDVTSRVAEAMVVELAVYAAGTIVYQFVQILVVCKRRSFMIQGFVTLLYEQ